MKNVRATISIEDELYKSAVELADLPKKDLAKPSKVIQHAVGEFVNWKRRMDLIERLERDGLDLDFDDLAKMRKKPKIEMPD